MSFPSLSATRAVTNVLLAAAGASCLRYPAACATLLISTRGDGQVPGYDGAVIKFDGTDVLGFCWSTCRPALETLDA